MAPVVTELRRIPDLDVVILLTGQHREQLDAALTTFGLEADVDLDVMLSRQTLPELAARIMPSAADHLRTLEPDYLLVHGDTLSAFCVTLTGFFERIPVGHVEAGLRSGRIDEPFPEEASRRLTDTLTDLDLAPTPLAAANLIREGKTPDRVVVTGQTGVDAIRWAASIGSLPERWRGRRLVTVTLHRRENWPSLAAQAGALGAVARRHPDVTFVYPVHLNPVVREAVTPALSRVGNVELTEPLEYGEMAALMAASELIVTDSGGMIEEGVSLGVPVAVVRNVTERPEGFGAGMAELVGTDPAAVERSVAARLDQPIGQGPTADRGNPYGDGLAARRVAAAVAWRLGIGDRPTDWIPDGPPAPGADLR